MSRSPTVLSKISISFMTERKNFIPFTLDTLQIKEVIENCCIENSIMSKTYLPGFLALTQKVADPDPNFLAYWTRLHNNIVPLSHIISDSACSESISIGNEFLIIFSSSELDTVLCIKTRS